MYILKTAFIALSIAMLAACAATPQAPVSLSGDFLGDSEKKVGVAMTEVPELDVHLPGAACLLCLAVAETANSSLSKHTKTLTADGVEEIKNSLADLMNESGTSSIVIDDNLDIAALPKFSSKEVNTTKRDFRSLKETHGITHLLVVDISQIGFIRNYANYVPTSDPKGLFSGESYLVNLNNNTYEWYRPLDIHKSVADGWKEPPAFPGLTNAFYQALETGKEQILQPFNSETGIAVREALSDNSAD
ncbi:MAG: hypothetical protein AAF542_14200 [Pseudomonadota bacterium]